MLSINISEMVWAIICFIVLYFILKKLLFNPLVSFMDARNEKISSAARAAEEIRREAEQLSGASGDIIKSAEATAAGIVADGEARDAVAFAEAVDEAKSELASMKSEKQDEISESIKNNSKDIAARRTELASAVADQILNL